MECVVIVVNKVGWFYSLHNAGRETNQSQEKQIQKDVGGYESKTRLSQKIVRIGL